MAVHKDNPDIFKLKVYSPKGRNKELARLKREGILSYNKTQAVLGSKEMMRQRKSSDNKLPLMCSSCKAFLSRRKFYAHKCPENSPSAKRTGVQLPGPECPITSQFSQKVLIHLRNDEIGELCKTDSLIVALGLEFFKKKYTEEKEMESCAKVRCYMRNLGRIIIQTKVITEAKGLKLCTEDIFKKTNIPYIESAINSLVVNKETIKHGMKIIFGYDLKQAVHDLLGLYSMSDQDTKYADALKFEHCLKNRWNTMFRTSELACKRKRFEVLRKPQNLPKDKNILIFRNYVLRTPDEIMKNKSNVNSFIELRNLVFTRIVIYNGRRANEASRILISNMRESISGVWFSNEDNDITDHIITYVPGKDTSKLVSVLIPAEMKPCIILLMSSELRLAAQVHKDNDFLFPSTRKSSRHIQGSSIMYNMAKEAKIYLTSTQMRHFLSTKFARIRSEATDGEKALWYEHVGHSESINRMVYQCPRAGATVKTVGSFLRQADKAIAG